MIQNRTRGILTNLFTPWCRVLLEKLTGLQLVKKSPAFHGTRRFITALTSVRQLSLSWASPIQSINTHPTSWRSILILSTHLRLGLPSGLLPSGFSRIRGVWKKCDKRNSHMSSKLRMTYIYIYIYSNNDGHPVTKTYTPIHYACRHFISSNLNFTQLHFTTLHYPLIWLKSI